MRCGRAQQLMTTAADGELAGRRRRALDAHLGRCAGCRGEMAATARLLGALDALPGEAEVPTLLEQSVLRRVRLAAADEEELGSRSRWRWLPIPAFAVASAAVAALAVGLFRAVPEEPPGPAAVHRPPAGAPARFAEAEPARDGAAPVRSARRRGGEPPSEPPPELAAAPDLFMDLPMLKNLDKLEHFDAIRTTTLGDAPDAPDGTETPSNG